MVCAFYNGNRCQIVTPDRCEGVNQVHTLRLFDLDQVGIEHVDIKLKQGAGKHPDGHINELEFGLRKALIHHAVKDCMGEVYIVDAIPAVGGKLRSSEVLGVLTLGIVNLCALSAYAIRQRHVCKGHACIHAQRCTPHALGVHDDLRVDVVPKRQYARIKRCVVRHKRGALPINRIKCLNDISLIVPRDPHGRLVVALVGKANRFKLNVIDVRLRSQLR